MNCRRCGTVFEGNFCPNCGEKAFRSCPRCGTLSSGNFCSSCGASFSVTAQMSAAVEAPPVQQQPAPVPQISSQKHKTPKNVKGVLQCPVCGSHHVQLLDNNPAGTRTSLNLNPLRPFTITNTKKKTKRLSGAKVGAALLTGGLSIPFTGLRTKVGIELFCTDCGAIFTAK